MDDNQFFRKQGHWFDKTINSCRPKFDTVLVITFAVIYASSILASPWRQTKAVCAAVLTDKPTSIRWLSKYRPSDIQRATEILDRWKSISLSEYRNFFRNNPDTIVFVKVKDAGGRPVGVLGDVELFELTEDYAIFAIRDRQGHIHAVDLEQKDLVVLLPEEGALSDVDFIDRFTEKAFFRVDLTKLSSLVSDSRQSLEDFPEFEKIKKILNMSVDAQHFRRIQKIYSRIGEIASYSVWPVIIFWGGSTIARVLGIGKESFILQHASNFYLGLVGMAFLHANFSSLWVNRRSTILTATVLTNLAFNVIEEVDFGFGRISRGASSQFGSDWLDFSSGMLAIAVYLLVVELTEGFIQLEKQSKPPRAE